MTCFQMGWAGLRKVARPKPISSHKQYHHHIIRKIQVIRLREETVQFFSEEEEEFINLLIEIGMKRTVAIVLVFFAGTPEATSREIERGTDLRQPEISIALKYLMGHDWIVEANDSATGKGRPMKRYTRVKPLPVIIKEIGAGLKTECDTQLDRVKKLRDYLP